MTTRRAILAGLSALPVAALAVAPVTTASALVSPDAGLLALAAHALVLNERHDAALDREARIEDRVYARALPTRPARPELTLPTVTVERQPDGSFTLHSVEPPAAAIAANEAAQAAHDQAVAAWIAAHEARERHSGLRVAQRASRRADRRLTAACVALTTMRATTLQGIAAKARVSVAVNPDRHYSTAWMLDLSASVMRDVLAAAGNA